MRSTITLEDDVEVRLRAEMKRSGRSFKEVVNEYLRIGLATRDAIQPVARFVVKARPLGLKPGLSYDDTSELIEAAEGARHR